MATKKKPDDTTRRLLYLLHMGLVEIHNLDPETRTAQAKDLASILEVVPRWILDDEPDMELLRGQLAAYRERYEEAGCYDYVSWVLDGQLPKSFSA